MAGTVATVPAAKRAVHYVTAQRHAPKPVRRAAARPASAAAAAPAAADCPPGVAGATPVVPLVTYASPIPDEPGTTSADSVPVASGGGSSGGGGVPVLGGIGVGGPGGSQPVTTPGETTPVVTTPVVTPVPVVTGPVPEPATWLLMIGGAGAVGMVLRRRRGAPRAQADKGTGARALGGVTLWSGSAAVEAGDMAATVAVKSTMASVAGKAMLCVCPAAIVAGSVVSVPPLRTAVHAATAVPVAAPAVGAVQATRPCIDAATIPVSAASIDGFPAAVGTVAAPPVATSAPALAAKEA